jgi:plasmid stabilization system protein ParE
MTLLPPSFPQSGKPRTDALEYDIAQEQAAALGRLGRALEAALSRLSDHDQAQTERGEPADAPGSSGATRARLLRDASYALWCFAIQRETCGRCDLRVVVREYGVPAEVQNRMGAF